MSEISNIKKSIEEVTKLKEEINNMIEFTEIDLDEDMLKDLKQNIKEIKTKIEKFEIEVLLNGEFDHNNAYMEIHSGAGGTGLPFFSKVLSSAEHLSLNLLSLLTLFIALRSAY